MANATKVKLGPGTLYVAVFGTAEPTSISGAWPGGFTQLGYTDAGSDFSYTPSVQDITVEEEVFPIDHATTGVVAQLSFAMAEQTANNLLIALNAGTSADRSANTTGSFADGTWVEPPAVGTEKRVAIGWDALDYNQAGDAFARIVARKCFQTGTVQISRRKAPQKALYAVTFNLEKPAALQPFRAFFPTSLTS